jgi:hypothetical protein
MKSALSLTLIVCLVASAAPVAAQEQTETLVSFGRPALASPMTAGFLTGAVTREAARLAAVPQSNRAQGDWARVIKLAPGTKITVTVKEPHPATRYFVAADDSQLTVLNLTDPTLPAATVRAVVDAASKHPSAFATPNDHEMFVSGSVRLGSDGVLVAGQKVADLGQIVERIERIDVVEITGPPAAQHLIGSKGKGALIGLGVGALVGGLAGSRCYEACTGLLGALIGAGIGAGIGTGIGEVATPDSTSRQKRGVLYRAP